MRDTKRQFAGYSFMDYDGIRAHLEEMSEKGWLFQRIGPFWWVYRRVEPRKRSFYVSYFPQASEFDPRLTGGQEEFVEFCQRTGWRLAGTSAQMQIFYNESEDPVPIETDPALEVETIHRAAKKSYLPAQIFLLVLSLLEVVMVSYQALTDPLYLLTRWSSWFSAAMFLLIVINCGTEVVSYFLWLRRARRAAGMGERARSVSHRRLQKVIVALVVVLTAVFVGDLLSRNSPVMVAIFVGAFGVVMLEIGVSWGLKALMKRLGVSRGINRTVTLVTAVVISVVLINVMVFGVISYTTTHDIDLKPRDPLPLTAEEYFGEPGEWYIIQNSDGSPVVSKLDCYQRADGDRWNEKVTLEYTLYTTPIPALRDLVLRELLEKYQKDSQEEWGLLVDHYEAVETEPWQARGAYRRIESFEAPGEPEAMNCWLLVYDRAVVELDLGAEPTREQMDLVAVRLGGVTP